MTIFILGTPFETAQMLDPKRLNKQFLECDWIINMATGQTKPSNHPAYLMYKDHIAWVKLYKGCLEVYREYKKTGSEITREQSKMLSELSEEVKPEFLCQALYNNFKKRLYTKDPLFYKEFAEYGTTEANYYYVDNQWIKYENNR